jgi:hypothetical protein
MQTSIEWLEKELKERYSLINSEPLFEQAKEMRKAERETLYTEEQVREAIEMARSRTGYVSYEYTENEIIQSLNQSKKD